MLRILSVAAALTTLAVAVRAQDATVTDALAEWRTTVDSLRSFDVEVVTTHSNSLGGEMRDVSRYVTRHRFLNGMWRVDRIRETPQINGPTHDIEPGTIVAVAWDGQVARTLSTDDNIASVVQLGKLNPALLHGPIYHELFRGDFYGTSYPENIGARADIAYTTGERTLEIVAGPQPNQSITWNRRQLHATLDTASGYMPTRIAKFTDTAVPDAWVPAWEYLVTLKNWEEGVIAPVAAERNIYGRAKSGEDHHLLARISMSVRSARFNIDIPPLEFALSPPPGTIVYDAIQQRNFLQSTDGRRNYEGFQEMMRLKYSPFKRDR